MSLQILPVRRRPLGLMLGALLGALLGAFASCAGRSSPSAPAGPTVRNGASVQLVSDSDAGGIEKVSPLVPADEPERRVDSVNGRAEPELYRPCSAAVLPDGRVVVGHAAGRELLLFDAVGVLVRTIGRAGSGPGELRAVASVFALPSGHVVTFDQVQRRAIRFDALGAALEQRSVAVPPAESGAFRPDSVWVVATDGDVRVPASRPDSQADTARDVMVLRFRHGTEEAWRLAAPDAAAEDSSRVLPGGALTLVPFARQPLAAVCGDDRVLADAQALRVQRLAPDASLRGQSTAAACGAGWHFRTADQSARHLGVVTVTQGVSWWCVWARRGRSRSVCGGWRESQARAEALSVGVDSPRAAGLDKKSL